MKNMKFTGIIPPVAYQFQAYSGRNIDQMPLLRSNGRTPITGKQLMIESLVDSDDGNQLRHIHVAVAALHIGDPEGSGESIIVPYSVAQAKQIIDHISSKSPRAPNGRYLWIDKDVYESFKKNEPRVYIMSASLSRDLANKSNSHPEFSEKFYEVMAEGDLTLKNQYIEKLANSGINKRGFQTSIDEGGRLVYFGGVHNNNDGSYYGISDRLRLIGILEANAQGTSLDEKLKNVPESRVRDVLSRHFSSDYTAEIIKEIYD